MRNIIIIFVGLMLFALNSQAQCNKKKYCPDNWGDYDYASQSSYASLAPGDTSRANVVLYAGQQYRIFVCSDPKLGDIGYQVVLPERKTKRTISEIRKDTVKTYKLDEYGEYAYDDNGNMIVTSKTVTSDTIWLTERYTFEKVLFDSKNNKTGKAFFEYKPAKSGRLQVKIKVPGGDPEYTSCVNIYVGRKAIGSKSFSGGTRFSDE